jgi:hypothetical protein
MEGFVGLDSQADVRHGTVAEAIDDGAELQDIDLEARPSVAASQGAACWCRPCTPCYRELLG